MLETKVLRELGLVDIDILSLKRKKKTCPKPLVEPLYKLNETKKAFQMAQSKYKNLLEHLSVVKEQKEQSTEKLKQIQEKLQEVAGTDYQKLLREQIKVKKNTSFVDRRLETTLSKIEEAKKVLEDLEIKFVDATEKYEDVFVETKDKISEIDDQLDILNNKRDSLLLKLEEKVKLDYLKSYKAGHGKGLAFLNDNRCGACHITLPPNFSIQVLKQEELTVCPSCGRLLLVKEEKEDSDKTKESKGLR